MSRLGTIWARGERLKLVRSALKPGDRVLDCGCGDGWLVGQLRADGVKAYGTDLRGGDAYGDVRFLPFKDASFDAVVAFEVLEHVDCVAEIRRVLKPGGRLIVTMPTLGLERLWDFLIAARVIQPRYTPHVNFWRVRDLPLKCVEERKCLLGLNQFGVLVNEPRLKSAP